MCVYFQTITSAAEYMTTETPAISFSCTDPEVDSVSTGTCNDPKFIRTVKAAMGLHSNRGVVFLDDGDYIYCSGMNDFTFNYGSTCTLGTLYNDVILDPTGAFPEGPDAAAEFITSSTTDVRYYLFLGQCKILKTIQYTCKIGFQSCNIPDSAFSLRSLEP